jgi:hypothetical protein
LWFFIVDPGEINLAKGYRPQRIATEAKAYSEGIISPTGVWFIGSGQKLCMCNQNISPRERYPMMLVSKRTRFSKSALCIAIASVTLLSACSDDEDSGVTVPPPGNVSGEPAASAAYSIMPTGFKQPVTVTHADGTEVNAADVVWTLDGTDITGLDDPFTWSSDGVLLADVGGAPGLWR